jgi:two-component system chemotaxis sensor kinase CheA
VTSAAAATATDPLDQVAEFLVRACKADELDERLELAGATGSTARVIDALNALFDKLWVKDFQLGAKQEMLEKIVEIRTNEVHEILDHVNTGFLLTLRDETVLDNFSRSCTEIFGLTDLKGRKISELLGFDDRRREHFSLAYQQIFDGLLPPEVCLGQLPSELTMGDRSYSLQGAAILGHDGQVAKVFFTINDTTEIRKLELENALRQALIEIVRQKDSFRAFLHETRKAFQLARRSPSQARFRNLLHTAKGNFGCFGLHDLAALIHTIEDATEVTAAHLQAVEDALKRFLVVHRPIIGLDYDEVSLAASPELERLHPLLETLIAQDSMAARRDAVASFLATIHWVPAGALLAPLRGVFDRVSQRLEKAASFELTGQDVLVDPDRVGAVFSNLGHLIRNSLDHGIEPCHERGAKPLYGRVSVACRETPSDWIVEVTDDGRGINVEAVAEAAVARGQVDAKDLLDMSRTQRVRLIGLDGVTTKLTATLESGRGVGTAALIEAVHAQGGDVKITTIRGEGTKVTVRIPQRPAGRS